MINSANSGQQQAWTPEMIFRYFNAMEPPPFAHVERLTKDINAALAAAYTEAFIDVRSELESRIEALTQQLAAERRRREQAEQTMQEIAETYKVEMERYRRESGCPDELTLGIHILQLRAKEQRLLSALAAIDAALKAPWTDVGQILAPIDLSALHEHDAEVREKQRQEDWDELAKLENKLAKVREPMVEALFQCVDAMNTPELRHARCSQKYVNAHKAGRDALAKVKEQ